MSDGTCPFCGAELVEETAPAAVGWAIGLALLGAACGPGKLQGDTGGGSTGEAGNTGGASAGTTTAASDATGEPTTSGATTQSPTSTEGSSSCGAECGESSGGATSSDVGGPGEECDQFTQNCPRGQKCAPASLDGDQALETLICVPVVPNPGQTGEPCTAEGVSGKDTCDIGNLCFHIDPDTGDGLCVAQCEGSPDQPTCEQGTSCLIDGDGVFTPCLEACDPLAPGCPDEQMCLPWVFGAGDFVCLRDGSGDEGQTFDPCEWWNGCDPGHLCANPVLAVECDQRALGCCLAFCDLSVPTCTGAGAQCLPWYEEGQAPPGLEDVGICGIPE